MVEMWPEVFKRDVFVDELFDDLDVADFELV